jgi:hypothetical protein
MGKLTIVPDPQPEPIPTPVKRRKIKTPVESD